MIDISLYIVLFGVLLYVLYKMIDFIIGLILWIILLPFRIVYHLINYVFLLLFLVSIRPGRIAFRTKTHQNYQTIKLTRYTDPVLYLYTRFIVTNYLPLVIKLSLIKQSNPEFTKQRMVKYALRYPDNANKLETLLQDQLRPGFPKSPWSRSRLLALKRYFDSRISSEAAPFIEQRLHSYLDKGLGKDLGKGIDKNPDNASGHLPLLFIDPSKRSVGSVIAITYSDTDSAIRHILNPQLGRLHNFRNNSYHAYFSIGLMEELHRTKYLQNLPIHHHYNLPFEQVAINVGYDDHSWLVYLHRNQLHRGAGDRLFFRGDDGTASIPLHGEQIVFEGEYNVDFSMADATDAGGDIESHVPRRGIQFEAVRVDRPTLDTIAGLKNLKLYVHKTATDNYFPIHGKLAYWNMAMRHEEVFQWMIRSLPEKNFEI